MTGSTDRLFDDIAKYIADSKSLLGQGALMELAGLDKQVKALCDEALKLSGEDRKFYAVKLQVLMDELTALGNQLMTARDSMNVQMQQLAQQKKALNAYKVADARDRKKDDK